MPTDILLDVHNSCQPLSLIYLQGSMGALFPPEPARRAEQADTAPPPGFCPLPTHTQAWQRHPLGSVSQISKFQTWVWAQKELETPTSEQEDVTHRWLRWGWVGDSG